MTFEQVDLYRHFLSQYFDSELVNDIITDGYRSHITTQRYERLWLADCERYLQRMGLAGYPSRASKPSARTWPGAFS